MKWFYRAVYAAIIVYFARKVWMKVFNPTPKVRVPDADAERKRRQAISEVLRMGTIHVYADRNVMNGIDYAKRRGNVMNGR